MLPSTSRARNPLWRSPFSLLDLPRYFGFPDLGEGESDGATASYPVDVDETDDEIRISAELPGFKKEEVELSVESGMLTVRAERTTPKQEGTKHVHERRYTRVQRTFSLPSSVDESKVDASLTDGVLHIRLPKRAETKMHKIKVK